MFSKILKADKKYESNKIVNIPKNCYLHVIDLRTNLTSLEVGPKTYIREDDERVTLGPEMMIAIPPHHFCIIENPVVKDDGGEVMRDAFGEVKLCYADQEVRLAQDPFPLWPGEILKQAVTRLKIVGNNAALRLKAVQDFEENGNKKFIEDEWLFEGPGMYTPRKEVMILETIFAITLYNNQAIRLKARKDLTDRQGHIRVTGEEWLFVKEGAFLPGPYEEVVKVVDAYVLNAKKALHVRALKTITDQYGVLRKNGEEWLIKATDADTHIPGVYEEVVGIIDVITLSNQQYCVVIDPVDDDGHQQLGQKRLLKGAKSFFLLPGETLENGIKSAIVLEDNEGLIIKANVDFFDKDESHHEVHRKAGCKWMVRGPCQYILPVEAEIVDRRMAVQLDRYDGIYVRNMLTGQVRSVVGETYLLGEDEELFKKDLPPDIEQLFAQDIFQVATMSGRKSRDKSRIVAFRVPLNMVVNVFDFMENSKSRVVVGPGYVMLGPRELCEISRKVSDKAEQVESTGQIMTEEECQDLRKQFESDLKKEDISELWVNHLNVMDEEVRSRAEVDDNQESPEEDSSAMAAEHQIQLDAEHMSDVPAEVLDTKGGHPIFESWGGKDRTEFVNRVPEKQTRRHNVFREEDKDKPCLYRWSSAKSQHSCLTHGGAYVSGNNVKCVFKDTVLLVLNNGNLNPPNEP